MARDFERLGRVKHKKKKKEAPGKALIVAKKKEKEVWNQLAKILDSYLQEQSMDLLVVGIVDIETGEKVFEPGGDKESYKNRFDLVLKNIHQRVATVDVKSIMESFPHIFDESSGIIQTEERVFDEEILFYNYEEGFGQPVFEGVFIKITVQIPYALGDGFYTGERDAKLSDTNHIFSAREIQDWFGDSEAYVLCREWDKMNGSPVASFKLSKRIGDAFVHYHLTVSGLWGEEIQQKETEEFKEGEEKEEAEVAPPGMEELIALKKKKQDQIESLQRAMRYLTSEFDKLVVERRLKELLKDVSKLRKLLTVWQKDESRRKELEKRGIKEEVPKPGITPEVEGVIQAGKEGLELAEREAIRKHEEEMARIAAGTEIEKARIEIERLKAQAESDKLKIETEKLKIEEHKLRVQEARMKMISEMVERGFTFEQIKDLIG